MAPPQHPVTGNNAMARLKTVIHVHTHYSYDSDRSPEDLVHDARCAGVDCAAVTDHDEIAGALVARELGGVQIIVGEEITSADGHIIGLFLHERVPPGLSAEETAHRIRDQGGLVLAPHPFTILCDHSLGPRALARLRPWLDAVEVCNAQDFLPWENTRARRFAAEHQGTPYVGDDSHMRGYLAACYQMVPAFDGPVEFRAALRQAVLVSGRQPLGYFATMAVRQAWRRIARRPLRDRGGSAPAIRARAITDGKGSPAQAD